MSYPDEAELRLMVAREFAKPLPDPESLEEEGVTDE